MNYYIVVEGSGDKQIYQKWIPFVNPKLRKVNLLNEVDTDCFFIASGGGYPNYFQVIKDGIETVNSLPVFDRFIISVDSEDFTKDLKYNEIQSFLDNITCNIPIDIIVQHFCIETWLLGNSKIGPKRPKKQKLIEYKSVYDVSSYDPEGLPSYTQKNLNRAQFALTYLKACLADRNKGLYYQKSNPKVACHPKYFKEIKKRCLVNKQVQSFDDFLKVFV